MRTILLTLLALGLACAPALAQRPAGDRPQRAVYRVMQNKLDQARVSLDFADAPLEDVIQFFRNVVDVNILIDPEVRKQQLKVTLAVKQLKAGSALKLVLSFHKLTQQFRNGVLLVTTADRVEQTVYGRVYDVRDMLFTLRDFPGPKIDITDQAKGAGATITEPPTNEANELSNPDRLIEVIKGNAAKGAWEGNPKISISMRNGLLVVNQTRSGHYEVHRLLMLLRSYR